MRIKGSDLTSPGKETQESETYAILRKKNARIVFRESELNFT